METAALKTPAKAERGKHETREQWLSAAVALLDERFLAPHGYKLPERWNVSCGWPKGGSKGHSIGQCWPSGLCEDETTVHMFISPELVKPIRVLDVLLHELIHASIGCDKKHGKEFRAAQKKFGLEGRPTATYASEGTECFAALEAITLLLGHYPHAALRRPMRGRGTGGGGWVRYRSPTDPSYTILVSPKSLERWGAPLDPDSDEMIPADRKV